MNEFKIAFEQLLRFRLPVKEKAEEVTEYHKIPWYLPIIGLINGIAIYLTALLILYLIQNRAVASVICAAAIPFFQWWLYKGRNLTAVNSVFANFCPPGKNAEEPQAEFQWSLTAFNITIFLKVLAVGLIVYFGLVSWLLIIPLLGATAYAEFLAPKEETSDAGSSFPVHWCITGVVTLLIAGAQDKLIAGLFVLVIAWLAAPYAENVISRQSTCEEETRYRAVMEFVEIAVLWIGLLAVQ